MKTCPICSAEMKSLDFSTQDIAWCVSQTPRQHIYNQAPNGYWSLGYDDLLVVKVEDKGISVFDCSKPEMPQKFIEGDIPINNSIFALVANYMLLE